MSARTATLQPRDSAELLRASARLSSFNRGEDPGAFDAAKRDLILCMERQSLLLATTEDGAALRRPSTQGGLLLAFTDDEAAEAWRANEHPDAPDSGLALTPEQRPRSDREGRKHWLGLFERHDAAAVIVNPAGPLGFGAYGHECRAARPRLFGRSADGDGGEPWLDLAQRAAERARARALLDAIAESIAANDDARFDELRSELPELNRMKSLATGVADQVLSGRWRLVRGETQKGLYQLLWGGVAWGRYAGDPYRAIDTLIEGGELLEPLHEQGVDDPEQSGWVDSYLTQTAAALAAMPIGYREQEIDRFANWRSPPETS